MLLIACPYCGPRNEVEFSCGGESHIARPSLACDDQEWSEYLFFRDNPRGLTFERWHHKYGCGSWFNLVRDTRTHEILVVYGLSKPKPMIEGEAR